MPSALCVVVNGKPHQTDARSLIDLVAEMAFGEERVATAVNGTFVAVKERSALELKDGDHVEIVSAREGG